MPGALCASLFPAVIGRNFPGALYALQKLKFRRPVLVWHSVSHPQQIFVNDTESWKSNGMTMQVGTSINAQAVVASIRGRNVLFNTSCFQADGQLVVDGSALARLPQPSVSAD